MVAFAQLMRGNLKSATSLYDNQTIYQDTSNTNALATPAQQQNQARETLQSFMGHFQIPVVQPPPPLRLPPPGKPVFLLELSTYKIFRHKKFSLKITVETAWRIKVGLSPDDILMAGLNAKVYKEGTSEEVVNCPVCCPDKKVISVGISANVPFASKPFGNTCEQFVFDECKSNCSSSRDHLHAALILVVQLPGVLVKSNEFALQARAIQSRKKKSESPNNSPSKRSPSPLREIEAEPPSKRMCTTVSLPPSAPQLFPSYSSMARTRTEVHATVQILSTTLLPQEMEILGAHIREYAACIPGYISFQMKNLTGLSCAFLFYSSPESSLLGIQLVRDYLANENSIFNVVNRPLLDAGVSIICTCKTW